MRKIIQIAVCGDDPVLFALCDDGSVWHQEWHGEHPVKWVKEPDIPQDKKFAARKLNENEVKK